MAETSNPQAQPMVMNLNVTVEESNPRSPYYLHSGDHPGLLLASHLLSNCNYHSWSHSMYLGLKAKNKLRFINRTLKQPPESDSLSIA